MLVLKRKIGETVVVGDDIKIQVLGVEGETVKLGFLAPKDIEILRLELYESIREENIKAGKQELSPKEIMSILDTHLNKKSKKE
jgi:carbon storage regulator